MSDVRKGSRVRAEAAKAVDGVVSGGKSLDTTLEVAQVAERDLPLLRLLCFGVLRHHWRLRWQLSLLLDRPVKARDSIIESLLAVGLYQIEHTRIPDHAAVSVTVEAARLLRRPKYSGLINAVLRNFMRRNIAQSEPDTDEAKYDHPAWLLSRLRQDWPEQWQEIAAANNERAPMWLRVNSRLGTRAAYLDELAAADIGASVQAGLDDALCLDQPCDVSSLPGFSAGKVSVQDGAAQIAAPWLLEGGGRRILDACAAPGGKTAHLLELADAELCAVDIDPKRLTTVEENLQRLGLHATLRCADASNNGEWWDGVPFDRILLDSPCSATGVIRRHPDIRLLRRDSDIANLAKLQNELLSGLWPLLAPGGRLLYVTCSVLNEENEAVVGSFLASRQDAQESKVLPNNNIHDLMHRKRRGYQLLPGTRGLDGFYFACLEKDAATKT